MGMTRFLDPLRVEAIDATHWRLLEEFRYDSEIVVGRLIIPAGFETDFASVPRVPLVYLLFGGEANAAAVIHDYLYTTGIWSKAIADRVFLEAMEASGVPFWRRWWMYAGVRLLGGSIWQRHRDQTARRLT